MSSAVLDFEYGNLLSEVKPQVVHDEALNQRYIQLLEKLDENWDKLGTHERKIHELLVLLIQDFEKKTYKVRASTPIEALQELVDSNNLRNKDLVGIFATESIVSEVLKGKRALTVEHIRRLAVRFNVSPSVFV